MKKSFLLLFLITSSLSLAQKYVQGKVISYQGKPLEGASVYLNNTTVGTITKDDGSFSLIVYDGNYELIISHIGYKTRNENFNTQNYTSPLKFVMIPETNILDEVVLKPTIYDDEWRRNLEIFKNTFLGRTKLSKTCEILNPKVLHFETNKSNGELTAISRSPLRIKNKGLGYLIEFDLVDYILKNRKLTYLGYSKYQELPGGKSKQRHWKRNRLKAYNGSRMHFVRSLRKQTLRENGFLVHQFRRVKNTDRPSEDRIKAARELIRLNRSSINLTKKISNPKTALDSAVITIRKAQLPEYRDYLYKKGVPYNDIIEKKEGKVWLDFDDYLSIIYTKEKEEEGYLNFSSSGLSARKKVSKVQTSSITLLSENAILDPTGEIINPLDYFSEGYWAFESFADSLPLDYQPN